MQNPTRRALLGDSLLLLAAVIWGSAFVVVKNTLDSVGPFYTMALRFLISALGAALIFGRGLRGLSRRGFFSCLGVGALLFLAFAFQTVGLKYTTPGKNAFLTTTYVVLVPLVCWVWKRRRPGPAQLLAAGLALVGIALISLNDDLRLGLGDGLSILCGLFFALHIVAVDQTAPHAPPQAIIVVQFAVAAALSLIIAPLAEPSPFPLSGATWAGLFYLGAVSALLGFSLQTFGQRLAPPSHAAILLSLEAVFGCLTSWLVLREQFTLQVLAGCGVMLFAVLFSEVSAARGRAGSA